MILKRLPSFMKEEITLKLNQKKKRKRLKKKKKKNRKNLVKKLRV